MPRRLPLTMLAVFLTAALLLFPWAAAPAQASSPAGLPTMLLTLDGIKGSFNADSYKDAIEVSDYSFGGAADVMSGPGAVRRKDDLYRYSIDKDDGCFFVASFEGAGERPAH